MSQDTRSPGGRPSLRLATLVISLAVAMAAVLALEFLLHGRKLPLGIPSEWAWERLPVEQVTTWAAYAVALLLLVALAGWVGWGLSWIERARRWQWIAGLVVTSLLVGALQIEAEAMGPRALYKWATALYLEQVSGQYTVARQIPGNRELLAHYNDFLRGHPPSHVSTHPPGWFVVYRGLLSFFEQHEAVASWMDRNQPRDMSEALDHLEANQGAAIPMADRATIAMVALASRATAILVVLPVAWLVRIRSSRSAAWLAAAVAGLVPASILFAPRSDTIYPTWAALELALCCYAVRRKSTVAAAAAGLVLFAGLFMSLVFAAVAALGICLVALEVFALRRPPASRPATAGPEAGQAADSKQLAKRPLQQWIALLVAAAGGLLLGPALLYLVWDHNVFECWSINLAKNAEFYKLVDRSYWSWVLVNPIELAVAMGLPVAIMLVVRLTGEARGLWAHGRFDPLAITWLVIVLALNFSGLNLGEVARLWLFLMPLGAALAAEPVGDAACGRNAAGGMLVLLQGGACLVLARDLTVI